MVGLTLCYIFGDMSLQLALPFLEGNRRVPERPFRNISTTQILQCVEIHYGVGALFGGKSCSLQCVVMGLLKNKYIKL